MVTLYKYNFNIIYGIVKKAGHLIFFHDDLYICTQFIYEQKH